MEMSLAQRLQTYILAEIGDSEIYEQLAKRADDDTDKQLLLEMSRDEAAHADEFKGIYRALTGKRFEPEVNIPAPTGNFFDILRERVLDESGDARKYAEQYYLTNKNPALHAAYFGASTDEGVHAWRLLYMLSKEGRKFG